MLVQKKVEESQHQMQAEYESERSHHQKLVKDYGRLLQRFENLQGDIQLLSPTKLGHHRSLSGISNISLESESSTSTERTDIAGIKGEEEDVRILYTLDQGIVSMNQGRLEVKRMCIYRVSPKKCPGQTRQPQNLLT